MLLNRMGREPMLAGLRHFIELYKDGPDYPVLQDFTREMRPFAPDTTAYDAFVKQWFFEVKVPEYRLEGAKRAEGGAGSWSVTARLRNTGAGTMPVEVAAVAGERFAQGRQSVAGLPRGAGHRRAGGGGGAGGRASPATSSRSGSWSTRTRSSCSCGGRRRWRRCSEARARRVPFVADRSDRGGDRSPNESDRGSRLF